MEGINQSCAWMELMDTWLRILIEGEQVCLRLDAYLESNQSDESYKVNKVNHFQNDVD